MSGVFPDYHRQIQVSLKALRPLMGDSRIVEALAAADPEKMKKVCEEIDAARRADMEAFLRILEEQPKALVEVRKLVPPQVLCRGCNKPIGEEFYLVTRKFLKPTKGQETFYIHHTVECSRLAIK